MEILDAQGSDAVSMREVGSRLGLSHTSLYRHVASRDELLVLTVDAILGELRPPPRGLSPERQIRFHAGEFRRVLTRHPAVVPLLTRGQLLGPNALRARERGLHSLQEAGADDSLAALAYLTLAHFVIGQALLDAGGAQRTVDERAAMAAMFAALPADEVPLVRQMALHLNAPNSQQEFDFGLDILLEGIMRRVAVSAVRTTGHRR